ncbi:MAG: glycosyltransferase family 2 protein [Anaerolineae bacterium]
MTPGSRYPFVTVIMPVRNEAAYIARSLGAVLAQDYPPDRMEVLVVDGMSEDGTREIVRSIIDHGRRGTDRNPPSVVHGRPSVFLLDNLALIVPTALNLGLRHARGEVIVRVDGHCEIASNYVRRCVEVLQETGADNVGGIWVTVGETLIARAIALAQSSRFGVGGAAFRVGCSRPGFVDTVPFGAYRREVFQRIGGFDEELVRNQDDEFNFRLTQAGGKIWLDPSIRSVYYSRASLRGLWRQYFQYGLYKVRVMQKRRGIPSWRHLVPGAFVAGLLGSGLLALVTRQPLWALSVAGPYVVANGVASLWAARRDPRALAFLPLAFATLHLAYGLGFLWGLWRWRAHHKELIAGRSSAQEAPHA